MFIGRLSQETEECSFETPKLLVRAIFTGMTQGNNRFYRGKKYNTQLSIQTARDTKRYVCDWEELV